jgi:uncharacterized RDD family membrane protein YckC
MDTRNEQLACPLCRKHENMGKKAKPLYNYLVCKKCKNSFADRRAIAYVIDITLLSVCSGIVLGLVATFVGPSGGVIYGLGFFRLIYGLVFFLLFLPLFLMKDGFSGSSPGKAMMGVQVVVETTGQPIGFEESFKRNLPLIFPVVPFIAAFQLDKGNRIGDGWANTRVIWKKYRDKTPFTINGKLKEDRAKEK